VATLTNNLYWTLISISVIQVLLVASYLKALIPYWNPASKIANPKPTQKAAIILCLRGGDPFLSDCIRALLQQDYGNYEVHIVVDSQTDPAWEIVQQTLKTSVSAVPVKVMALTNPRATCSLKCSSLLQAINGLAADIEIVALVDADTVAHPLWLQELVRPFADPQVGIVTGNRWYVPRGDRFGTYARYLWNAFSVVSMYVDTTPWGGTIAVRADHLRQPRVQERWGNALCEDVPLYVSALKEEKLKFKFVPALLIVNQEECDLKDFIRWSMRQQTLVRLYHPRWWKIGSICFFTPLIPLISIAVCLWAIATQQWQAAAQMGQALAIFYGVGVILPLVGLHYSVQRVLQAWSRPLPPLTLSAMLRILLTITVTFVTSLITITQAARTKVMQWRGISYRIESSQKVHLVEYFPFEPSGRSHASEVSAYNTSIR
jgi:cellulose synthase/poly-beta-1,6-N-acetylglucosamine synthase-like glycosyltransferase